CTQRYLRSSKLIEMLGISGIRPASLLLLITIAGGVAAFAGLAWAAWPGDLDRIIFRKTINDRRSESFVKDLSLPRPVWPLYSPYFYDGTNNQAITLCP